MRPRVTIQRVLAPLAVALLLVGVAKSQTAGASARVVPKLVLQLGHGGPVHSITFSPNGELLASASDDQTVRL